MIQPLIVDAMQITGAPALDTINVYWEDFGERRGQVTITCWGEAWTCYWGSMPENTVREFFLKANDEYIANRLQGSQFQKRTARHTTYLKRIVRAIKAELKALTEPPAEVQP